MVRGRVVRDADQGRHQGDDSRPSRRGVPLGRNSDALHALRPPGNGRGAVGKGILSDAAMSASGAAAIGVHRGGGALRCEDVEWSVIASAVGTPTFVYSAGEIRAQYETLRAALAPASHRIHYSVKANSNLAVLALLRSLGAGVDIVSGGELFRALHAGFVGADIVFSGVGKTDRELGEALEA